MFQWVQLCELWACGWKRDGVWADPVRDKRVWVGAERAATAGGPEGPERW